MIIGPGPLNLRYRKPWAQWIGRLGNERSLLKEGDSQLERDFTKAGDLKRERKMESYEDTILLHK